ncbi:hypothetical protein ONZ45_g10283 [Pleurotus djamor]|nr:hypothetical protein ONZ45_g10283 [Pleurotus djamor]
MSNEQITLYATQGSPFGHFVEIALREANLPYNRYEIDLQNKPTWFSEINHLGKVPAITYGGPLTAPDKPSKESHKLAESIALLEFFNDIAPEARLLPANPVHRARVRFAMQFVMTRFQPALFAALVKKGSLADVVQAVRELQPFLPGVEGKDRFIGGEWFSLADATVAAFLVRLNLFFKHDLGSFPVGEGAKTYEELQTSEEFAKYRAYLRTLLDRSSVKATFSEEYHLSVVGIKLVLTRA